MNKMQWKLEFYDRFCRHEAELTQLYRELYHNDMAAFDRFAAMLYDAYTARPEALKLMDRAREAHGDWYKGHDLVGMLMYVNAFAGTLQGVREKLGYIEDCGVNYLHLMPLLESPKGRSDGGYAVSDFRKVQPELGTMEDLYALAMDCHERGIAVCLDFVMNHTSEDHEWAKRARAGERDYQDRYFFYEGWDIPNAYEQTVPQVFPTTAPGNFTWCEEAHKVVMTTFYPYQWDLNYANPAVFQDMTDNMLNLCNHGVDVIRLDAVPYIWKALGTNCRNLPQVHTLVRMMRMVCEIVCPGTLLLGEVVMEPSKVVPYFAARVPHALQRDHHGYPLAHRGHRGRAAPPAPDGPGLRPAQGVHLSQLPPLPRRHRLGVGLPLSQTVRPGGGPPQAVLERLSHGLFPRQHGPGRAL